LVNRYDVWYFSLAFYASDWYFVLIIFGTQSRFITPKTKMKTHRKIIFPISKEHITEHHLKAGDILTIAKVTNDSLVLMPKKESTTARQWSLTKLEQANKGN